MRAARPLAALVLWACGAVSGQDGVRGSSGHGRLRQVETYDVEGRSARELRRDLDRRGPLVDGRRFDARTRWYVRWHFDLAPVPGGCRALRPQVDVEVTLTLPRWRRPSDTPAALVQRWERYLAALRGHEEGHTEIGYGAAQAVEDALSNRPAQEDCDSAESEANQAAQAEVARAQQQDLRYDRETGHGASQGARFP